MRERALFFRCPSLRELKLSESQSRRLMGHVMSQSHSLKGVFFKRQMDSLDALG